MILEQLFDQGNNKTMNYLVKILNNQHSGGEPHVNMTGLEDIGVGLHLLELPTLWKSFDTIPRSIIASLDK